MVKHLLSLLILFSVGTTCVGQTLKVMSYNIHHGADKDELNTLELMGKFIKRSGADIVGLQEVDSMCNRSGNIDQMKELAAITGMHYAFVRHFAYDGGAYGLGILSKYPIGKVENKRISILPKDEKKPSLAFLTAEIALPRNRKLLFGSVHYSLNVPSRLKQTEEVLRAVGSSDMPVILTGDLNANPDSQEILNLGGYFTETGAPNRFTFPVKKPVKKIDYVMVSKAHLDKVLRSVVSNDIHLSDHLPLTSVVRLKD